MTRARVFLAVVVLAAAVVVACSAQRDDSTDSGAGGAGDDALLAAEAGEVSGDALQQAVDGRDIIYTASLAVRVDDVEATATEAAELVEAAGGHVAGESSALEGDQVASLTLRVPSPVFREVMADLGDLGSVEDRSISSADVTDEVVDVEGRLATLRGSADRLRQLLADAASTADIVAVEAELANREAEIESLEGRLRVLDDQVTYATIDLHLSEESQVAVDDELPGFVASVERGFVAMVSALVVLAAVVGFLLPFVPLAVAGWFLYRWFRRRRSPSSSPGAPPARGWSDPRPPVAPRPAPGAPPDAAALEEVGSDAPS